MTNILVTGSFTKSSPLAVTVNSLSYFIVINRSEVYPILVRANPGAGGASKGEWKRIRPLSEGVIQSPNGAEITQLEFAIQNAAAFASYEGTIVKTPAVPVDIISTMSASIETVAAAPVNTTEPVISGSGRENEDLTTTTGEWTGYPTPTFTYQWRRDTVNIAGATSSTYTVVTADVGTSIDVVVTATNTEAAVAQASSNQITGLDPLAAPVNTVAPLISGSTFIGATLTTTTGTWTGNPTPTYTYQWRRDNVEIGGATASTYTLVQADDGTNVDVVVTATNSEGVVSQASSNQIGAEDAPVVPAASLSGDTGPTFAVTNWFAASATDGYEIGLEFQDLTLPASGEAFALGTYREVRDDTWPSIAFNSDGDIIVRVGATTEITEVGGISAYESLTTLTKVAVRITSTTLTLKIDDANIATSSTGWTIPTSVEGVVPIFFGNADTRSPGIAATICNAYITDLNDSNNSAFYYLVADGTWSPGSGGSGWKNECVDLNSLVASGSTAPWCEVLQPVTQVNLPRTYTPVTDYTWRRFIDESGDRPIPDISTGTRYYVSTDGDNGNTGTSSDTPWATVAYAISQLTSGVGDQVLFKRGDTWSESIDIASGLVGASEEDPIVFGAYGVGARPRFTNPGNHFIDLASGGATKGYFFFKDLDYDVSSTRTVASQNFGFIGSSAQDPDDRSYIWIENCRSYVSGSNDISSQGTLPAVDQKNCIIRRCVFDTTCKNSSGNAQGMFFSGYDGLVIEECVFNRSHRGASDPGGQGWPIITGAGYANAQSHAMYIQSNNRHVETYGVVTANSSSHGLYSRSGGIHRDFVSIGDAIAFQGGDGSAHLDQGVCNFLYGAFIISGDDIHDAATPTLARRFGPYISNDAHTMLNKVAIGVFRSGINDDAAIAIGFTNASTIASGTDVLVKNFASANGKFAFPNQQAAGYEHRYRLENVRISQQNHPGSPNFSIDSGSSDLLAAEEIEFKNLVIDDLSASNAYQRIAVNTTVDVFFDTDFTDDGGTNDHAAPTITDPTYSIADFASSVGLGTATEKGYVDALLARDSSGGNWNTAISADKVVAAAHIAFDL